jgi:hypothetical protein
MYGKDRCLARGQTVKELIALSWSQADSSRKLIFDADVPDYKYDFIVAGQSKWWEKLESEITSKLNIFGFTEAGENGGLKIRYRLVRTSNAEKPAQISELQQAQAKLAEAKNDYGADSPEVSKQQRVVDEIASATGDEQASRRVCIGNLRQIDGAKEMWALENKKQKGDVPTTADLLPYLGRNQKFPVCPDGGTYIINAVGEAPTCSVSGHVIPNYKT